MKKFINIIDKSLSFLTMILCICCLNIWKYSEFNSLLYWVSLILSFGLIGWWWEK